MVTPQIPRIQRCAVWRAFVCTFGWAVLIALMSASTVVAETPTESAPSPTPTEAPTTLDESSQAQPEAAAVEVDEPPHSSGETPEQELARLRAALFGSGVVETSGGCAARATCDDGSTISCVTTTGSSGSCDWQDQDCDGGSSFGFVVCGNEEEFCPACPPDCSSPPISKCIPSQPCEPGCGHCGPGSCLGGTCNCLA